MTASALQRDSVKSCVFNEVAGKSLEKYLRKLENHCRSCEDDGRYEEADATIRRLDELKHAESGRLRHDLRQNYASKINNLKLQQSAEIKQFTQKYNKRLDEFDYDIAKQRRKMTAKFERQKQDMSSKLDTIRFTPKFSTQLLNLRNIQQRLAKQKMYSQAELVKKKADRIEQQERDLRREQYFDRQTTKMNKLVNRQEKELKAWEEKVMTQRFELVRQRNREMEVLKKRHSAQITDAEKQHAKDTKVLDFQIMFAYGLQREQQQQSKSESPTDCQYTKTLQRPMSALITRRQPNSQVQTLYLTEGQTSDSKQQQIHTTRKRPQSARCATR